MFRSGQPESLWHRERLEIGILYLEGQIYLDTHLNVKNWLRDIMDEHYRTE